MEIIRIAGYGGREGPDRAAPLIPNTVSKHGLRDEEWSIDDDTLLLLIRRYTREAGVPSRA